MSIPVALQQFKSAGVYRIVYDKSTILNQDTSITRLVVGYSPKGPFNIPVLVRSISEFKTLFGEASKSLEKRGVYFHRIALQALLEGPILALNLKKFSEETLFGATIDTTFNPSLDAIDTVELSVEDIYDTTRFWELSAFKLAEIKDVTGKALDGYISLSATNTKDTSISFFIRKATGQKVAGYNVTVSDWYNDSNEEIPEWLQNKQNSLISDFFAEIYIFKGEFTADQVLTSETLKNYFQQVTRDGEDVLELRPYVVNPYGDAVDTLDALYNDATSGALTHYVGALIPYFKDKQGVYRSLDILMNNDIDTNNVMMNFNVDLLDDGIANIDLSGRVSIPVAEANGLSLNSIYAGTAKTTVLGNSGAPVIADKVKFGANYQNVEATSTAKRITGNLYAKAISAPVGDIDGEITLNSLTDDTADAITIKVPAKYWDSAMTRFGIQEIDREHDIYFGGIYCPSVDEETLTLPEANIVSITNYGASASVITYTPRVGFTTSAVSISATSTKINAGADVNGTSISFIPVDNWDVDTYDGSVALISTVNSALLTVLEAGDCLLAADASTDADFDGDVDAADGMYDNIYVQETGNVVDSEGNVKYFVKLSGTPLIYNGGIVKVDDVLNKEIGHLAPVYLEGYTYFNAKPASTSMYDKVMWQNAILSTLTDYKGLRTGLLSKADVDYRYIVDTFETYVEPGAKNILSFLAKEKQSAFAILNFPSVRTFVKCPYTSFTDSKGIFNVEYVVKGYNPKKAHTLSFSLPSDSEGASFCAFYTPLKFSDGYIDSMIPSAGLVSNLFVEKYRSRQPYYIIAGPSYGVISASGMTGPDYNYSREELNIIEPYGVNCMVYRPGFGTFINANQTAKQTPVSALSAVNVRELVIYLQDEIEKLLQSYQWEFNNATVRAKIKDKADIICQRIQANGGIQDFVNIMDESNNTPEIIDNEMAVLSTHIEPGRGMGKMVHELTLYRTGMMRASIAEA